MISLLEIAQSINEDPRGVDNIDRSKGAEKKDQDADRVGREDGDTWMAPNGDYGGKHNGEIQYFDDEEKAKVYAKSGSGDSKGGEEKPEEPAGNLGGSDFDRDFDDKGEEPKGEPESGDEPKKLSSDEIDKKVKDLGDEIRNIYQSGMSPQDSERYIDGLQKQIDDLKSQKGGDDNAESDDKNTPEKENEKIEKELQNIAKDKGLTVGSEDANYGGEIHSLVGKDDDPDNTLGFHAAPNFDDDGNMTNEPQYAIELGMGTSPMYFGSKEEADAALQKIVDDERIRKAMDGEGGETLFDLGDHAKSILKGKDETINVNLKQKYDRIFRSLK